MEGALVTPAALQRESCGSAPGGRSLAHGRQRALSGVRSALLGFALMVAGEAAAQTAPPINPDAIASPPNLPSIGKWMIDRDGTVAHWLGQIVNGKRLFEPVNVILIDPAAASEEDARARLLLAMRAAGYPVRFGHSAGYRGLIGGEFYRQMPAGRDDAFSNRLFEESNNHGRIFGPHALSAVQAKLALGLDPGVGTGSPQENAQKKSGGFIFIGAFSRERVDLLEWPGHRYASFLVARDDLAARLVAGAGFRNEGSIPLDNAIAPNLHITTGDHDGRAVVLKASASPVILPSGTLRKLFEFR